MENQTIEKINCCRYKSVITVLSAAFLIVLILFFAAVTLNKIKEGRYIGKPPELQNTISFTGTGEIFAKPDLALITFAVQNEAKTVAEAVSENTQKMNAVIDAIKKLGVEIKDLKTASFNIYPRYEFRDKEIVCMAYPCPTGERVLVGYEVYQSLQVKIRNLEKVGGIIQSATDMGATDASGLQFIVENEDELRGQARKMAIDEAKSKAKELVLQLGVKLGRIVNFSEGGAWPVPYFAKAEAVGVIETPQIEPGENKISITVTITYEIH